MEHARVQWAKFDVNRVKARTVVFACPHLPQACDNDQRPGAATNSSIARELIESGAVLHTQRDSRPSFDRLDLQRQMF